MLFSKIRYHYLGRVLCVIAVAAFNSYSQALLGAAKFEDCEANEFGYDCNPRQTISVPVSYESETRIEALVIKEVDKNGEPQSIEETCEIKVSKSRPQIIYPLSYLHTVPYFPYEEVTVVPNNIPGRQACEPLTDSCYCCNKTLQELLSFSSNVLWRGEELLNSPSSITNSFSTMHCYNPGELLYDGFTIGEGITTYEINIEVVKGDQSHNFTLSPNMPIYSAQDDDTYTIDQEIKARLIGQTQSHKAPPYLANKILYIPSYPETHPYVQDYPHNMLLVPAEEVSFDGSECNKVGVGHETFRHEKSECNSSQAGDCLHNQLFHKHNSDLQKLIQNPDTETKYLVHGQKAFKESMAFSQGMKKRLVYADNSHQTSIINLVTEAESFKIVNTESIGVINEAYVKKFQALTRNGKLMATITNYGDLKSEYVVTVSNFNMNVDNPPPAQTRTLEPGESANLVFDINTNYNLDQANVCMVTLKSPTGRIYDSTEVHFDTEKYYSKFSWELQEKNQASDVNQ